MNILYCIFKKIMPISETLVALIINNSFILAGALAKYIGDSECVKLVCCKGMLKIENLHHINSEAKHEADETINTMQSTITHPITIIKQEQKQ